MLSQIAAIGGAVFFTGAMIYAALEDARCYTIRNKLVLAVAGGWLLVAPLAGLSLAQMGLSLGTGALVLAVTFTLFALNAIGGGDAKLAAAAALWLGPEGALAFALGTMLIGGVLAMALLAFRAAPLPATLYGQAWVARLQSPQTGLPYAVAMAPAALLALPSAPWLAQLV
ncbi:prepilin peptidase CpaA [Palleronia aestuarii]|uniref:Prepilin peptidase CpaA n=1 Tax=Palleronia aestuarii TaxID=568105 RepID=A0A2W7NIV0_9RHOB|nr:prepilin peptidase [Palleronia aestuarii]PZX13116.1 prepilin peptidase CpaA [Palleronia aestuarii]